MNTSYERTVTGTIGAVYTNLISSKKKRHVKLAFFITLQRTLGVILFQKLDLEFFFF